MSRPSLLTDELRDQMCDHIRTPMAATHAAALVGVSETTYFRWMQEGAAEDAPDEKREFRDAVMRARADAAQSLVAAIEKRAVGHEVVRHTRGGEEIREWDSDWKAAAWLLERMNPDEYGNRQRVEHSGGVAAKVEFELGEEAEAAARDFLTKVTGDDRVGE